MEYIWIVLRSRSGQPATREMRHYELSIPNLCLSITDFCPRSRMTRLYEDKLAEEDKKEREREREREREPTSSIP